MKPTAADVFSFVLRVFVGLFWSTYVSPNSFLLCASSLKMQPIHRKDTWVSKRDNGQRCQSVGSGVRIAKNMEAAATSTCMSMPLPCG